MAKNKFYVTTPIYYLNNAPHIGHAYTTLIADVLSRYNRFKSGEKNVWFLAGTDEHGAKVAQAAEKTGKTPQEFTDKISELYKKAWKNLNISNNDFIRTTEPRHMEIVEQVLLKLKEAQTPLANHFIYKGNYEGLYCVGCESYKKESDLVNGKCPDHDIAPQLLNEENWYLKLSDYAVILKQKISDNELKILPETRKKEVLGFIEGGLEDVAISRENVKWGIPIPWDKKQTVYVWVDALINYISGLGYPKGKLFKNFWPADLHVIGKDILKFHTLIWPAMLISLGAELPKAIFIHGYMTINGQKMSKTVGNVIDPNNLVAEFGQDAARYLILSQFPAETDGDVKADDFTVKYNSDLANGLGNLVSRVVSMDEKYCGSKVPKAKFTANFDLSRLWQTIDANYEDCKIFENIKEIWKLIQWCDGYIDEKKPWHLAKASKQDEIDQIIYNLLEIIRHLSWLIDPILPAAAKNIRDVIGEKDVKFEKAQKINGLKAGTKIGKVEPLFVRK
ncbi:MAG: class I tRNA ligase family protein [Parcubacteria group bacterium]